MRRGTWSNGLGVAESTKRPQLGVEVEGDGLRRCHVLALSPEGWFRPLRCSSEAVRWGPIRSRYLLLPLMHDQVGSPGATGDREASVRSFRFWIGWHLVRG